VFKDSQNSLEEVNGTIISLGLKISPLKPSTLLSEHDRIAYSKIKGRKLMTLLIIKFLVKYQNIMLLTFSKKKA